MPKKRFRNPESLLDYTIRKIAHRIKRGDSIHADFHPLVIGSRRAVEADFNFIKVDVYDFLTVGANLGNLAVKVDRISTARTARDDNTNDFCFLLHDS